MFKKNIWPVLKKVLSYYAITRLVLIILMIGSEIFLPFFPSQYTSIFALFDNEHYLTIAQNGYSIYYHYAFFPLVPILIRYLGRWGFLILNQILVILTGYLLYLIDTKIFKNDNTDMIIILWMVSPISIFTMMFYTEAIFMFLTTLGYYLYKEKKHYLCLGIVIGLAVMARSIGSMLFFTIFILMVIRLLKKEERFINILITYIPATIISCIYPVYLYIKTGKFLYFIDVQAYWLKIHSNIFTVFIDAFKLLDWHDYAIYIFNYFFTLILFGYIIYIMIKRRKEKKYYDIFLYMILSLIAICSVIKNCSDPLTSYYRYMFGCFAIYFMIDRNKIIATISMYIAMSVATLFLLGTYFY